eukprot:m.188728 g.188728  ORF g.188728 m.188728 type:complete len:304 (+) comp39393_c1_seq20:87-998(+)
MLRRASFHSLLCLPRPHARHASFRYQFTRVFSSFPTPGNRSASSPSCDAVDAYGHPRIPFRGHYDREKCDKRRSWAESFTGKKLGFLSDWWAEDKETDASLLPCDRALTQLRGNVENPIGLAKIPVGLVGPLLVYGKHTNGYYLCPYATTEGALVASATRGAIACNRAGGVRASASQQRVMRAPAFVTGSIQQADALADWLVQALPDLQEQVSGVSRHCRLIDLEPLLVGRTVHILFLQHRRSSWSEYGDNGDGQSMQMGSSANPKVTTGYKGSSVHCGRERQRRQEDGWCDVTSASRIQRAS